MALVTEPSLGTCRNWSDWKGREPLPWAVGTKEGFEGRKRQDPPESWSAQRDRDGDSGGGEPAGLFQGSCGRKQSLTSGDRALGGPQGLGAGARALRPPRAEASLPGRRWHHTGAGVEQAVRNRPTGCSLEASASLGWEGNVVTGRQARAGGSWKNPL